MTGGFSLPVKAQLGGQEYDLHTDFRDILEIFSCFSDPDMPEYLRWRIAVGLFYEQPVPEAQLEQAMEFLADFICQGKGMQGKPSPALLDWEQDAHMIAAEINRAAGQEVRSLPYVHWWTFLGWFHTIGQGQLSTVISVRHKLRRGQKLEPWEKEFYRENKEQVDLKKRQSREELAQKARLEAILAGKEGEASGKSGSCDPRADPHSGV